MFGSFGREVFRLCCEAMAGDTLLEACEDGVLTLTMNRPRQKNAFSNVMWRALGDAFVAAREDDDVRAVVLTGAGDAFTAGQDLSEMAAPTGEPGFPHLMDALCAFDKPLLAAVNGVGVGFGFTVLLHCDVVYVSECARVKAPFVTLGVVPEAGASYLLPLQIGHQRAADLLFRADWIEAAELVELGLASRLLAPDALLAAAQETAARFAAQPLGSVRYTKRLLLEMRREGIRAARALEDQAFAVRVGSPENAEALKAFFEKRPADFRSVSPKNRGE